jgi:hypothetical protein
LRSLEEEEARLEATGAYAPEEDDEGGHVKQLSGTPTLQHIQFLFISTCYHFSSMCVIQNTVKLIKFSSLSYPIIDELDEEEKLLYDIIKDKQAIARKKNHETKTTVPKKFTIRGRSESSIREQLETVGLESDGVINSTMGGKKRNR